MPDPKTVDTAIAAIERQLSEARAAVAKLESQRDFLVTVRSNVALIGLLDNIKPKGK